MRYKYFTPNLHGLKLDGICDRMMVHFVNVEFESEILVSIDEAHKLD